VKSCCVSKAGVSPPNKSLQVTFDPPPTFATAKAGAAPNAPEHRRYDRLEVFRDKNHSSKTHRCTSAFLLNSGHSGAWSAKAANRLQAAVSVRENSTAPLGAAPLLRDRSFRYQSSVSRDATENHMARTVACFRLAMNEYELHDHRREQDFRSIGGNFTNFYRSASSVDSVSKELYCQQAFYIYYTSSGAPSDV